MTVEGSLDQPDDAPDWVAYYQATRGREPRPLFSRGMAIVDATAGDPGHAVEIGFGDGTESLALLARGWTVTAVDPTPAAAESLRRSAALPLAARLRTITAPAQDAELAPFDLLYAGYALSFITPESFPRFWRQVRDQLRPGGFLVINIFGVRDTWADAPDMTFVDRARLDELLAGLEVLAIDEEDADGDSFSGPKHWHVFDVIAHRPVEGRG
jgi:SAM-dependent methyltransferase